MSEPGPRKGFRWWPAAAILLLCAAGLVANGLRDVPHRQGQTFVAFQILFLGLLALAVWLLFFSRLPWVRRWLSLGIAAVVLTLFGALFRIEGVSGDFIPILAWRWSSGGPGLPSGGAGTVEENSAWYPSSWGPAATPACAASTSIPTGSGARPGSCGGARSAMAGRPSRWRTAAP